MTAKEQGLPDLPQNVTEDQRRAIQSFVHSAIVPLIEDVIVKKLGQAAIVLREELAGGQSADKPRDREADRARFPDADFNRWLDEGISDCGHIVWHTVGDVADAWAAWDSRPHYALASDTGERGVVVEAVDKMLAAYAKIGGPVDGQLHTRYEIDIARQALAALRAQPAGGGESEQSIKADAYDCAAELLAKVGLLAPGGSVIDAVRGLTQPQPAEEELCHATGVPEWPRNCECPKHVAAYRASHDTTPPESGGQGELIPARDAPAEELWAAIYRLAAIAYRAEDGKPWIHVAAQLRMEAKAGGTVTNEMVEAALKVEAFERDGALWPDAYSSDEQVMERGFMRKTLTAALTQGGGNER